MVDYHVPVSWAYVARSFFWDEEVLHQHIKQYQDDYDEKDPKTWPVMTSDRVKENSKSTKRPLSGVAYSTNALVSANPQWSFSHNSTPVQTVLPGEIFSQGWISYPFNFSMHGYLRLRIGIPKADYELWMEHFGRLATLKGARNHNSQEAETNDSTSIGNTVNVWPVSASTYDRIMRTFTEEDAILDTTAALQEELENSKTSCQQEKERADETEEKHSVLEQNHKDLLKLKTKREADNRKWRLKLYR